MVLFVAKCNLGEVILETSVAQRLLPGGMCGVPLVAGSASAILLAFTVRCELLLSRYWQIFADLSFCDEFKATINRQVLNSG